MISYAITVKNEYAEFHALLLLLKKYVGPTDEIVVLIDIDANDDKLRDNVILQLIHMHGINRYSFTSFNNDFSQLKNTLTASCKNKWIFNIDADELPDEYLLANIHDILSVNENVEVLYVPRINIVIGITPEHIQKWGWKIDGHGRCNWPDYQGRIYQPGNHKVHWTGKVHETLVGHDTYSFLPAETEYCLHHVKDITKQESQNNFYSKI